MNIFENAYFGKFYRTRDGMKAVYIIGSCDSHWLAIQDTSFTWEYDNNGKLVGYYDMGSAMDIVSEWQPEIDEEKLDKLAYHEYPDDDDTPLYGIDRTDQREAFKAGYRKALKKYMGS